MIAGHDKEKLTVMLDEQNCLKYKAKGMIANVAFICTEYMWNGKARNTYKG